MFTDETPQEQAHRAAHIFTGVTVLALAYTLTLVAVRSLLL